MILSVFMTAYFNFDINIKNLKMNFRNPLYITQTYGRQISTTCLQCLQLKSFTQAVSIFDIIFWENISLHFKMYLVLLRRLRFKGCPICSCFEDSFLHLDRIYWIYLTETVDDYKEISSIGRSREDAHNELIVVMTTCTRPVQP